MTDTDKDREIAGALKVPWHEKVDETILSDLCSCGEWNCKKANPSFSDDAGAIALLRLMEEYEGVSDDGYINGKLFFAYLMYGKGDLDTSDDDGYIARDYITTRGKLRDAVHEWFKEKGVIK